MRKHFTLIELLVVIAIIAILAAILLPALQAARERGMSASCVSQLKQCGTAAAAYSDDHKGFFPGVSSAGNARKGEPAYPTWGQTFADTKYLGARENDGSAAEVTRCPKTKRGINPNNANIKYMRGASYAAPYQNNIAGSLKLGQSEGIWLKASYWRKNYHTIATSKTIPDGTPKMDVPRSELILFVDGMSKNQHASNLLYAHRKGDETDYTGVPFITHTGRANYCAWDFSVKSVSEGDLGDVFVIYGSQYMATGLKAYIVEGSLSGSKYAYFNTESVK